MAEYIEREAVVKLREEFWKDRCDYMAVRVTNIMNTPAADVVEVVRCKDCKKHGSRECIVNRKIDITGHPTTTKANSFCSYGERRDT